MKNILGQISASEFLGMVNFNFAIVLMMTPVL